MARSYSMDLREPVWKAWQAGEGSQRALAEHFAVGLSFVRDLSRRFRQGGTLEQRGQRHGPRPALKEAGVRNLRASGPATRWPSTARAWWPPAGPA